MKRLNLNQTDKNLIQLIALLCINTKVTPTCFGWYASPSLGNAHEGHV